MTGVCASLAFGIPPARWRSARIATLQIKKAFSEKRLLMLIITRKKCEKIIIADNIEITILEIGRKRVRFGIQAPSDIPIQTKLKTAAEDKFKPQVRRGEPARCLKSPRS
jgi:carbon storage regulator CsrA